MLKVQFFLVESISIGRPIRSGRGVDPYTVLLRDAIPAVFYLLQDTFILGTYMPPPQVGFWAFLA